MWKRNRKILAMLLLLTIAACTTLNKEYKKLLISTQETAEEAREQAAISAYNAQLSAEKADRIFKQSQKK